MSNNPTPPDCIAKAIRAYFAEVGEQLSATGTAEAVWDALCSEGRIEPREIYVNGFRRDSRVLVVPVGVCSPRLTRDAKQEEDHA